SLRSSCRADALHLRQAWPAARERATGSRRWAVAAGALGRAHGQRGRIHARVPTNAVGQCRFWLSAMEASASAARLGEEVAVRIDLNCDLGESYGVWKMGDDCALLEVVSSANIACGFHAGDPHVMHCTVRAAAGNGVAIGAHPSLPDLQGFGRRAMQVTPDETYDLVLYQVGALAAFCRAVGVRLRHVKPHGALYNMAARDRNLARAIAQAVKDYD